MTRPIAAAVVWMLSAIGTARAEAPAVQEGLFVRLEGGYAQWEFDSARIQAQEGVPAGEVQSAFVDQVASGPALALELGYNVKGHVTFLASLAGTGWDIWARERGGGGFVAGLLAWHPAELIPQLRDRRWDLSFFGGAGYGVVGELRALDGLHYQFGARAEWLANDWLSVGLSVRSVPLMFSRYVIDWNKEESVPLRDGSGGRVLVPALGLTVHAPVGQKR